ncbi:MAG TPA: deoxyribonuclease IV [Candidatus Paceibacterota bacterium]
MIRTKIGAHVSIAGGIIEAPERAKLLGCETFQCFTRSPQGGPAPLINEDIASNFRSKMDECGIETFCIHTPYYINFASLEGRIRHGSTKVVREELERGSLLGARYVVTHLGSHTGQTQEQGLERVSEALNSILDGYSGTTKLLLEVAAGTGNVMGDTFDELATILGGIKNIKSSVGVCFDTCHLFASGYDFRKPEQAEAILKEFDKKIGLNLLELVHVNDSKVDLGGKRDRHEHIGEGYIGEEGITSILSQESFAKIDWIIETDDDGREKDLEFLKKIRGCHTQNS